MRPNQTKRALRAGRPAIGVFLSSASPLVAEMLGHAGYDWVVVDLQHGENNLADLKGMLQAVSATPATPLVRIPRNEAVYIQRALDLGAYGVIVPLVNTRADAEAVVGSTKYPPAGERSWGPIRGAVYGGPDYFAQANDELLTLVMLETAQAVQNAREILSLPGIDGCFIGPNDLGISFGIPPGGPDPRPPTEEGAIQEILDAARACGAAPGIQAYSAEGANLRLRQGFRFVGIGSDVQMVQHGARTMLGGVQRPAA